MHWKLKVSGYGKIKSAEIEAAPLTLFVGDNNSGKSYLMSLLWGIQNFGVMGLFGAGYKPDTKAAQSVIEWIKTQVASAWENDENIVPVSEIKDELQSVLNEVLKQNKNNLISSIFNSADVKIKELEIELINLETLSLIFIKTELKFLRIKSNLGNEMHFSDISSAKLNENLGHVLLYSLLSIIMGVPMGGINGGDSNIYLPAARTGFMLTKDIINKVGRNTAFNIGMSQREMPPFTRPINQFLDVMNDLTIDSRGREEFDDIIEYLESGMAEGNLDISGLPNKEVSYAPAGRRKGLPLRVVSAVVTELSPLILILKHKDNLDTLFYEEPEMCLHPELQQKMGRVICRLLNAGVKISVTTHSDIILQHINNMICMSARKDAEGISKKLGYISNDFITAEQVKVYQLKSKSAGKTEVEELVCGDYGFTVPTFNDALDRITDEAYTIQE